MKAMVIYDSAFGNTAQIARAIGNALGAPQDITVSHVNDVKPEQLIGLDLLIVGSPTQGFRPTKAVTHFLNGMAGQSLNSVKVAAFDTRISTSDIQSSIFRFIIDMGGYAAKPIGNRLVQRGGNLIVSPEGFYVAGKEGPLKPGELERAAEWARQIMAICLTVQSAMA